MARIVSYEDCPDADLIIDAVYEAGTGNHPIIFFCGGDIVNILMTNGFNSRGLVEQPLQREFAVSGKAA